MNPSTTEREQLRGIVAQACDGTLDRESERQLNQLLSGRHDLVARVPL